jgi:hypothetical protein
VMKALEKDPEARFRDVREFAAAIAPYGPPRDDPTQAVIAVELRELEASGSGSSRRKIVIALSAVLAIGVAGGVLLALKSSSTPALVEPGPEPAASAGPSAAPSSSLSAPNVEPVGTAGPLSEPSRPTAAPSPAPLPAISPAVPRQKPTAEPAPTSNTKSVPPAPTGDPNYL